MFTFPSGASRVFMKAFRAFIKPFQTAQIKVEMKIYVKGFYSCGIETGRDNDSEMVKAVNLASYSI